ncbi:hypothetical protein ACVWYN_002073 [Pedobacter sp. UYP24]
MGKLLAGPYGPTTGKIGNNVQYMLNGKNVIRMRGIISKPPTIKQLANRQRMKVANDFVRDVKSVINVGFKFVVEDTDRNQYNEAVSYHKKNAVIGEYPNHSLDYAKVKLSAGELPMPVNAAINRLTEGVEFIWDTSTLNEYARRSDKAMLLIYYPESGQTILNCEANRSDGKQLIVLPEEIINGYFESYMFFLAWDGNSVSESIYIVQ